MIRRDFEIYRYRYMDEVELHHHDFYEIYMLLRGSVSYTVENRIFHMRAGDLMLISPLELHQARVDSNDEPYERIVLWVDRGYLESLSSPHTSLTRCFDTTVPGHTNLLRLPGPRSAEMRRELDKLRSLHMQESYGSDLLAVCSLVELMVAINQSAADRSMQSALSADMASDRVVDGVLSYINEHYNEALTLDALAERFFISKYHLLRKFEAQVGTTVHRYILQKRLLNAKQLLAGGLAPSEVCTYCGFGDYATFTARSVRNTAPRPGSMYRVCVGKVQKTVVIGIIAYPPMATIGDFSKILAGSAAAVLHRCTQGQVFTFLLRQNSVQWGQLFLGVSGTP